MHNVLSFLLLRYTDSDYPLVHSNFWPLYCLFFFDIRILITPLVHSNFSYSTHNLTNMLISNVQNIHICWQYISNQFVLILLATVLSLLRLPLWYLQTLLVVENKLFLCWKSILSPVQSCDNDNNMTSKIIGKMKMKNQQYYCRNSSKVK